MVLALLSSGMAWNLSTWWLGLPVSSSHTLIGAILGIGLANSLLTGQGLLGGVNWAKAGEVGLALLILPVLGFLSAAVLLLISKRTIPDPELYVPPPADAEARPPGGFARSWSRRAEALAWHMDRTTARRGWD